MKEIINMEEEIHNIIMKIFCILIDIYFNFIYVYKINLLMKNTYKIKK